MVEVKWRDSRIHKPKTKCSIHPVIFLDSRHTFLGYATWKTFDGSEDGNWLDIIHTTGNKNSSGQVIFWQDIPIKPLEIEL